MSVPGEHLPEETVAVPVSFLLDLDHRLSRFEDLGTEATAARGQIVAYLGAAGIYELPSSAAGSDPEPGSPRQTHQPIDTAEYALTAAVKSADRDLDETARTELQEAIEKGEASEPFTRLYLTNLVAPYAPILGYKFRDKLSGARTEGIPNEPPLPEYQNVDAWGRHVKKFGRELIWTEDAKFGTRTITATYFPKYEQLVQFQIVTETNQDKRNRKNSVLFTFDQRGQEPMRVVAVATEATTTFKRSGMRRRYGQSKIFELDLEPAMEVRRNKELSSRSKLRTGTFSFVELGKGFRQHYDEPSHRPFAIGFRQIGEELLEALDSVPDAYRPMPKTKK